MQRGGCPHHESLGDTMLRTHDYFDSVIAPQLKHNNILVVAHGNSHRSLIMYLEKLDKETIVDIELKTGIPVVYELDNNLNILSKHETPGDDLLVFCYSFI